MTSMKTYVSFGTSVLGPLEPPTATILNFLRNYNLIWLLGAHLKLALCSIAPPRENRKKEEITIQNARLLLRISG